MTEKRRTSKEIRIGDVIIGGNAPSGAASSDPDNESASSTVFPAINSVATLATAIAVSHPKV